MSATDINDWPGHPDADPDCECCLGDGLQADGETPCPCIDTRKGYCAAQASPDQYRREGFQAGIAAAAQVLLDACPNPIFDQLKPALMGEVTERVGYTDEDGNEVYYDRPVSWDAMKEIIRAALRALKGGDATPAAQEAEPACKHLRTTHSRPGYDLLRPVVITCDDCGAVLSPDAHQPQPSVSVAEALAAMEDSTATRG